MQNCDCSNKKLRHRQLVKLAADLPMYVELPHRLQYWPMCSSLRVLGAQIKPLQRHVGLSVQEGGGGDAAHKSVGAMGALLNTMLAIRLR